MNGQRKHGKAWGSRNEMCDNQTSSPIIFEIPRENEHGDSMVGEKIGVDEHLE